MRTLCIKPGESTKKQNFFFLLLESFCAQKSQSYTLISLRSKWISTDVCMRMGVSLNFSNNPVVCVLYFMLKVLCLFINMSFINLLKVCIRYECPGVFTLLHIFSQTANVLFRLTCYYAAICDTNYA